MLPRNAVLPGGSASLQIPLYLLLAVAASAQDTTSANTQNTQAAAQTQQTQNTRSTSQATNTPAASPSQITISSVPDINASTSSTPTVSSISISDAPSLSTNAGTNSQFLLTSAPTIAGVGIPTQVVPYTANAPFMRKSNMPAGTVFIVVGAILGFLGACVLLWRGMVAWQLHRSVRKAQDTALYGGIGNESTKMLQKPKKSGTYNMATFSSTGSSDNAGSRHVSRTKGGNRGPSLSLAAPGAARQSSLFFSPTAGAGSHVGLNNAASRSSTYMPAGFYSSPSATAPAGGAYSTHIGNPSTSSLAHLNPMGPARAGYAPASTVQSSPPESPAIHPYTSASDVRQKYNAATPASYHSRVPSSAGTPYGYSHSPSASQSQLNLHAPGGHSHGGRAPSANLEELFDQRR